LCSFLAEKASSPDSSIMPRNNPSQCEGPHISHHHVIAALPAQPPPPPLPPPPPAAGTTAAFICVDVAAHMLS
jgi:hypothetical protein